MNKELIAELNKILLGITKSYGSIVHQAHSFDDTKSVTAKAMLLQRKVTFQEVKEWRDKLMKEDYEASKS